MEGKKLYALIPVGLVVLAVVLIVAGCPGKHGIIELENVASVSANETELLPAEDHELLEQLLESYNVAKYKRTANSGFSRHRLVITTCDGAVYSLYRINDHLVEVGLRQDDLRTKFFLESEDLAEIIETISMGGN